MQTFSLSAFGVLSKPKETLLTSTEDEPPKTPTKPSTPTKSSPPKPASPGSPISIDSPPRPSAVQLEKANQIAHAIKPKPRSTFSLFVAQVIDIALHF